MNTNNELQEMELDQAFGTKLVIVLLTVGLIAVAVFMMVHTANTDVCAQLIGNCTVIR